MAARVGGTTFQEITRSITSFVEHNHHAVVLFAAAFFTMIILSGGFLLFFVLRKSPVPILTDCSTLNCSRAVRDLELTLTASADPCRDFYGHVCSRRRARGVDGSFLESAGRDLLLELNARLISVPEDQRDSYRRLFGVAQFYQLCHRFLRAPHLRLRDMLPHLKSRYQDLLALSSFAHILERVVMLSLVQGIRTLLDVRLVRVMRTSPRVRIGLGLSLARKCSVLSARDLMAYLKVLLVEADVKLPDGLDASHIVETDIAVEEFLARTGKEQSYNISALGSLTPKVSTPWWLKTLNALLPTSSRITEASRVFVDKADAIKALLGFFDGLPRGNATVYLYAQVLMEGLCFDYIRGQGVSNPERTVKPCLRASWKAVIGAKALVYDLVRVDAGVVATVLEHVRSLVLLDAERSSWMGEAMKRHSRVVLSGVVLRSPEFATLPKALSKSEGHTATNISTSTPLGSFPARFMWMQEERQRFLLVNPPMSDEDEEKSDQFFFETRVTYDVPSSLNVPAAAQRAPVVYPSDVPYEFSLGTLGTLIARELLRAAVPSNFPELWTSVQQVRCPCGALLCRPR
ncbi:hypothetical protein HPB48_004489 [Haemaphysalis longicornis]|uniref:Peptidase M13 N-terminal domain-containing protein n=1 Tax=Haemaphysalis longicornis TaxID=44386 RepID=A0A9J6G6Q4_HAELO|nr:hypothetical protein HPB48_004489 [Haemaphysalis longicornis]